MFHEPAFAPTLNTVQTQLEVKKAKFQTVTRQQADEGGFQFPGVEGAWQEP